MIAHKKMIGGIVAALVLVLSLSGTVLAAEQNSTQNQSQVGCRNNKGPGGMRQESLTSRYADEIAQLTQTQQDTINDLQDQIDALQAKVKDIVGTPSSSNSTTGKPSMSELTDEQKTALESYQSQIKDLREQLITALKDAGIDVAESTANGGPNGKGGFGGEKSNLTSKYADEIAALSQDQQDEIAALQEQIKQLREEERAALGIGTSSDSSTTDKNSRPELTDEQKATCKEYRTQIKALEDQLRDLLKDAGIINDAQTDSSTAE